MRIVATFSIVACDVDRQEWGVGVQSRFFGVGPVVPWAAAKVGAIATQAYANTSYGPRGLDLLRLGLSAEEAVAVLTRDDPGRSQRQLGVIDREGRAAAYTGSECLDFAGHRVGANYACQGNILAGPAVVEDMARAFEQSSDVPLADRLVRALEAAQAAGGDRRGMQSAALHIVRPEGGYAGFTDRFITLNVDDHPNPIVELGRLLRLQRLYFTRPDPASLLPVEGAVRKELEDALQRLGYHVLGGNLGVALERYTATENFEERYAGPDAIDPALLDYMREQVKTKP